MAEIREAHRRIALGESFKVKPPLAAVSSPLWWRSHKAGHQFADILVGRYELKRHVVDWTAHWTPQKGRGKIIAFNVPEAEAKKVCEKHRLDHAANRLLENAGAGALVRNELNGSPDVFKRGRGRGR